MKNSLLGEGIYRKLAKAIARQLWAERETETFIDELCRFLKLDNDDFDEQRFRRNVQSYLNLYSSLKEQITTVKGMET